MKYPYQLFALLLIIASCKSDPEPGTTEHIQNVTIQVDDEVLVQASGANGDWITHGLNYYEDRYSHLSEINQENIDSLGLVWTLELGTRRGIEATPLVVDGIMYLSGPWSKVFAIDTRTGKLIWDYNPQVPGRFGPKACCDVVNRGVALYKGDVFFGTIDGRLISVDAATGVPNWQVYTVDTTNYYTITGAPRIVKGKVIIGNGGAEYGVRGYVSAYDTQDGSLDWRFFTVPGNPDDPVENPALEDALNTWKGDWWKYGAGGTVWDAMAYDPELNLLYIGTGNGSPWNREYRSPGGGDNLYLSSILALNPDDGSLVWYYQTTPGDSWDYTATQHIILADLPINGVDRKVIMQAPKNGFFYVLDREAGELISAEPYTYINWASHVDPKSGRPVENDFSRYQKENVKLFPGPMGGHNWQPMSYSHQTGLVYIPAREASHTYGHLPNWEFGKAGFAHRLGWNTAVGHNPEMPNRADPEAPSEKGMLLAWDPVTQKAKWRVDHEYFWNAGVLSTAGGLVFQANAAGKLVAYDADSGDVLWQADIGSGAIASPVTYLVDGKQYISIAVGWGGARGTRFKITDQVYPGTVYTFALGADEPYPDRSTYINDKLLINRQVDVDDNMLNQGRALFIENCWLCHGNPGDGGGALPDLAYSSDRVHDNFQYIVKGSFEALGMPNFSGKLTDEEITAIQQYIFSEASLIAGGN